MQDRGASLGLLSATLIAFPAPLLQLLLSRTTIKGFPTLEQMAVKTRETDISRLNAMLCSY